VQRGWPTPRCPTSGPCSATSASPSAIAAPTSASSVDGSDLARHFLVYHGRSEADAPTVWLGNALHTTFGVMNDDVLAHFVPGFTRQDFVEIIPRVSVARVLRRQR
jgi:hypothetical protein